MRLENLTVGNRREAKRQGLIHKRSSSSTVSPCPLTSTREGRGRAIVASHKLLAARPGPSYRLDEIERLRGRTGRAWTLLKSIGRRGEGREEARGAIRRRKIGSFQMYRRPSLAEKVTDENSKVNRKTGRAKRGRFFVSA